MGKRKVGICKYEEKDYELIYTDAETRIDSYTLGEILNELESGKIIDDIAEQRDGDQWSKKDKSLLIHTVFVNLSILPISMTQKGTGKGATKILIDGKQRLSNFEQYKNNEFALSPITPHVRMRRIVKKPMVDENGKVVKEMIDGKNRPVMVPCVDENGEIITEEFDYKVAGKFFDELPDALKTQFIHYKNMPQYVHINYTPEEFQMQMLRDNTSVKMTPAQIGAVLCGNDLAEWLREFRMHDLFLNYSTWSSKQENKSLIERCVVEGFVLAVLEGKWNANYLKNVDIFKENAAERLLEAYTDMVDNLVEVLKKFPELRKFLTKDNLHIIIAAYRYFCDISPRYQQDDFGKFLCKWFSEIKDTTSYEVEGNTGTKQTSNVLSKLAIINEKCEEYMREYGTVDVIDCEEDNEKAKASKMIDDFVDSFGTEKREAICSLMELDIRSGCRDDFSEQNIDDYVEYFEERPNQGLIDRCLDIQNEILNVQTEDDTIVNKYNLPILMKLYDSYVKTDEDSSNFSKWLKSFGDCEEPAFVEIGGKIFEDYNTENIDQTSNSTIVSKYAILQESFEQYVNNSLN